MDGNKVNLIRLVKLYALDPPKSTLDGPTIDEQFLENRRQIFDQPGITWKSVEELKKNAIPQTFTHKVLNDFLTKVNYQVGDDFPIECGTQKPVAKGREIYASSKTQVCDAAITVNNILFRATIGASMVSNCFR